MFRLEEFALKDTWTPPDDLVCEVHERPPTMWPDAVLESKAWMDLVWGIQQDWMGCTLAIMKVAHCDRGVGGHFAVEYRRADASHDARVLCGDCVGCGLPRLEKDVFFVSTRRAGTWGCKACGFDASTSMVGAPTPGNMVGAREAPPMAATEPYPKRWANRQHRIMASGINRVRDTPDYQQAAKKVPRDINLGAQMKPHGAVRCLRGQGTSGAA